MTNRLPFSYISF